MQRGLKIAGIVVAVLIVILIALPFIISVNSFRPKIESEASAAIGRPVTVGNLSLSLLSGSVLVDNIAIADDPAFSKAPFITAKSLKVGVELIPLIFSKQINVTGITLQQPEITLLKGAKGTWNFSSLGQAAGKQPAAPTSGASAPPDISIAELAITDGILKVGKANSSAKAVVYDKLNLFVTNFSLHSQFPFKMTAGLPGGGDANISGKAGPIHAADAAKTPFESAVKIDKLVIGALGVIDQSSGIGGVANFDGTLNSNGHRAKAAGLFTGTKLTLAPKGTPAPKTVTVKHTVDLDLDKESGTIAQGDVAVGTSQAHLTGTFQTQNDTQVLNLKLNAPGMSVDELEAMLPSMGIVLPTGSQLRGGTLSAELSIVGPVAELVITGPVKLSNSKLAGFDLGKKMGALSAFAGKSVSNPDTTIANASMNARLAPEGTRADNINLTVPAIGVITGAGTVSPAGALSFKMLADLHGGMVGGVSAMAGAGSGKGGIPFAIEGTTADPKIIPDLGSVVGGVAQGALKDVMGGKNSPANALGGLMGKKKPQ